ncbi:hypothetical protein SLS53_007655 [Cytospora paraplurivora]|uniref:AGC-kinase C-terminal domain-containing protein n=1 Tax=Cytospora paraplurivora TaxID=2898453 RepID=A0AAN9U8S0_9PEZI
MLSHFRIHRRGPSNPPSPVPDQLSPFDHADHPQTVQDITSRPDFLPRPTNPSNTPPVQPSSTRTEAEPTPIRKPSEQSLKDTTSLSVKSSYNGNDSNFMGGLALENYRRVFESNRRNSASQASAGKETPRNKPQPPPINTNLPPAHRPNPIPLKETRSASFFIPPKESQNSAGTTGKRPAGTRLISEPAGIPASPSATESQKGKKGLPFLKNPMSGLLMRRKASQNVPDLHPLPLPQNPVEATYDPRIKGTRVHDFSAPRQRVVPTRKPTVPGAEVWNGFDKNRGGAPSINSDLPLRAQTGRSSSAVSENTQTGGSEAGSQGRTELSKEPSERSVNEPKRISLEESPFPKPELPPEDGAVSTRSISKKSSSAPNNDIDLAEKANMDKTNPSTRTTRSRHISLSDGSMMERTVSALPKHMKSTSSRFSFDMVGAARAEKLLEERHRQRELERKGTDPMPSNHDSRFDDFDDDAFDYDAAMADDGFEEEIPMIGDDDDSGGGGDDHYDDHDHDHDALGEDTCFEEEVPMVADEAPNEEDDPDNDQENFAGFVFQRSNPQSSLATPATTGLMATPRDSKGDVVGFAMTKDTTPTLQSATSEAADMDDASELSEDDSILAGLGIQGLHHPPKTRYDPTVFQERRNMAPIDDVSAGPADAQDKELYFDEGLLEELKMEADEIQQSTFDESIFDIEDTDQFGRPIPGAFAQAMKVVQEQEHTKIESDITPASGISDSTAHTSVSMHLQPMPSMTEKGNQDAPDEDAVPPVSPSQLTSDDKMLAYQAALAEAAHKAAESGWKFKWEEQPEALPPSADPGVTITSPTTDSHPSSGSQKLDDTVFPNYDDDGFGGGFDDEFDDGFFDEDFIAEANAEALAYDSDGFYGQEFGFYSAPIPQGHSVASTSNGSSPADETLYGGYFGPSGVNRTKSGRVVSREPNLTPITERSEYSNRNSIMSLALPGAALGSSEGRGALQSPGLAQLAMMADDGQMNLESLLRLRNKAWGGSQISLSSSREGSPRSERAPAADRFEGTTSPAPWEIGRPSSSHLANGSHTHVRKNSTYSLWSNSDGASGACSPTLTMSGLSMPNNVPPQPLFPPPPPPPPVPQASPGPQCPPVMEDEEEVSSAGISLESPTTDAAAARANDDAYNANNNQIEAITTPIEKAPSHSPPPPPAPLESPPPPPTTTFSSPSSRQPGLGHRHKGSAESISYSMDEDKESGNTRWVMERRRTAESGEIEILGREFVTGGSI